MPSYSFNGKVAFVTGAAKGLGRSHAVHYARNGADVVIVDIDEEALSETAKLIEEEGQEAMSRELDVRKEDDVKQVVNEAVDYFGKIDFLANNAGIATMGSLHKFGEEAWDDMLETNLKGNWLCAKHVAQHMIERGEGGKIINTSSTAGLIGTLYQGAYGASKHGVLGLTKVFALELAEHDINVNAVCPGGVATPMTEKMAESSSEEESFDKILEFGGPMNILDLEDPLIEPRYVSEAFMWLSSEASDYVTGIALPVDAGLTAK